MYGLCVWGMLTDADVGKSVFEPVFSTGCYGDGLVLSIIECLTHTHKHTRTHTHTHTH